MIYIAIIALIINFFNVWMNYYKSKETYLPALQKLGATVNAYNNNHYFKLFINIILTSVTLVLIYIVFATCFSIWVIQFKQSIVGLFIALTLFSLLTIGCIYYYTINNDSIYSEEGN
ncbi:hypothetical protein [Flavobacterium sp.]|uniref:hypothetical protein n=1 Tax=Flavobacterium sp. TaxID=239 RepID=UPI00286C87C4|nr:hypothetical protein [Flavobacterium sp.]